MLYTALLSARCLLSSLSALSSPQLISSPLVLRFGGPPRSDLYCKLFHEGFNIHVVGFGIGIDFPAATHGIMSELVLAFALLSPAATVNLMFENVSTRGILLKYSSCRSSSSTVLQSYLQ
jgi:hypothetical protein